MTTRLLLLVSLMNRTTSSLLMKPSLSTSMSENLLMNFFTCSKVTLYKNNRSHSTSVLQLQWAVCIFTKPYERSIPRCLFASTHLCSFVRAPYSMTPDQKGRWSDFASRPRKISSRVCSVAGILNDLIRKRWACKQANEWVHVKVGLELKAELKPALRMTEVNKCMFLLTGP